MLKLSIMVLEVPRKAVSRSVVIAAIVVLALILVGAFIYVYGRAPQTPQAPQTQTPARQVKVAVLFDVGGEGDLSFNDMAALGARRAASDFGVKVDFATPKSLADMVPLLERLSREGGYDLLVLVGFLWTDALNRTADKFPQQKYALIDASTGIARPNVVEILFREQEVGALIGVVATGMARELQRESGETGPLRVGSVAGMSIPPLWRFHIGYLFGAKYFEAKTGAKVEFYWTYTGKFDDPALGYSAANTLLAQGVRVLYGLAGLTHVGMFNAVIEWNKKGGPRALAMGQDASQEWYSPRDIPVSGAKRVDVAVYTAVEMVVKGTWRGGIQVLGIAEGGVGVWDLDGVRYFAEIAVKTGQLKDVTADDVVKAVDETRKKYIKDDVRRLVKELEDMIKRGEIAFKDPRSPEEYESIVKELEKGNLNAALAKGRIS
jgi:basic membrane protein A